MTRKRQILGATEGQGDVKSEADEWLEAFESDFWAEYPRTRGVSKLMARRAWMRIKPRDQETCDAIFDGLKRWVRFWEDRATEEQFIPHPVTWLNQRRWEDEA